ncbi:MAG: peptide chain release factor-like protein [Verrucomicrobia bacterium]|nr:peptide chain release factor-like protein [Verrucomicrobiota bacterium]
MNSTSSSPPPSASEDLARRMAALGIREADLSESFVRSGGNGGQNVNKVATCVQLIHGPSGIRIKSQESRHQGANRRRARELLVEKLEALRDATVREARARIERARRSRRGRPRALKERLLQSKARRARSKELRRRPAE